VAADGSIIFEANLDDRQAQTKLNQLKSKIQRLQSSLEKSTGEQSGIKEKLDSAKASAQQTYFLHALAAIRPNRAVAGHRDVRDARLRGDGAKGSEFHASPACLPTIPAVHP